MAGRTQDRASAGGSPPTGWGFGLRVGADLIAGLLVGLGIGYGLDFWLGTKPWMMVLFLILGMAAGLMNVYRTIAGMGYAVGYRRPEAPDTSRQEKDG
ncbi:MAG: phosphoribosylaminoimidazolecarboxamide formyltransferase [Alphaproteobacteria bacterium]|nr:MAG: phosphoribosylaminoimidazolecarboxamide formyltransferase [Alphaproteobacteria bacterium]